MEEREINQDMYKIDTKKSPLSKKGTKGFVKQDIKADARITIRLTAQEKRDIQQVAKMNGLTLSELLRLSFNNILELGSLKLKS